MEKNISDCRFGKIYFFKFYLFIFVKGQCEPITLELCMNLPYNYTSYPNYLGHRTQKEASVSWESSLFPALVQTNCYKYLMFFACTILVPKCDPNTNHRIPPCRYYMILNLILNWLCLSYSFFSIFCLHWKCQRFCFEISYQELENHIL